MTKKWTLTISYTVAVGLALFSAGCSSSSVREDGLDDLVQEGAPAPEAGTDAVPPADQVAADAQPVPTDDSVAAPAPTDQPPADPMATQDAPAPTDAPVEPVADAMATPPGTQTNDQSSMGSGEFDSYSVQTGDTLMKIAFETYGDLYQWRRIFDLNRDKISNANSLPRGLQLKLEKPATPVAIDRNGERYLIKVGDTLGNISGEVYGTTRKWKKLWENNRQLIRDPNKIYAGFFLYYMTDGEKMPAPLAGVAQPVQTARAPASTPAQTATQ